MRFIFAILLLVFASNLVYEQFTFDQEDISVSSELEEDSEGKRVDEDKNETFYPVFDGFIALQTIAPIVVQPETIEIDHTVSKYHKIILSRPFTPPDAI